VTSYVAGDRGLRLREFMGAHVFGAPRERV
jgi:hypothetical protein